MTFGNALQLLQYYERIKYCCYSSNMVGTLNKVLPAEYALSLSDHSICTKLFSEYRTDLLLKYVDSYFSFDEYTTNYFSSSNRKIYTPHNLEEYYGRAAKETMFFVETLCHFLEKAIKDGSFLHEDLFLHYGSEELTPTGRVLYKAYLATLIVYKIIGFTALDREIDHSKKLLTVA